MDVRLLAVKSLIKILEENKTSDEVINSCADKVSSMPELLNLTVGTIKHKLTLDFFIQNVSSRPVKKITIPVRNILRAALYELEYLKKPDYAVINSYVEISKLYEKKSAPFVNGVLRNFLRNKDAIKFPEIEEDPIKAVSIKYSHPEWLVGKWIKTYGTQETVKICEFNNKVPTISIRINTLKSSKAKIVDLLKKSGVDFSESTISAECLILKNPGNIRKIAGYEEGLWQVQGEASSLVAKILDPQQGEKILDLCAAPGGKTTHIAALTKNSAEITAVDINKDRIKKIQENCDRLGVNCVKTIVADASNYKNGEYDRIILDAPCSNTGVFSKRSDARWKRTEKDIKNLSSLQFKILKNASEMLKEGGTLVYSTCSIEPEENILLIEKFLDKNKNYKLEDISQFLPWEESQGKDGFIQILQSKHNIDGFFIAKLVSVCKNVFC